MLNQGRWKTVKELVNLIMVEKAPSLDLPIGNTVRPIGNTAILFPTESELPGNT